MTVVALAVIVFSCAIKKEALKVVAIVELSKSVESVPAVALGMNLYDNNYGGCHKLYKPTAFLKEDWKPILVSMQKKAHLDDAQWLRFQIILLQSCKSIYIISIIKLFGQISG